MIFEIVERIDCTINNLVQKIEKKFNIDFSIQQNTEQGKVYLVNKLIEKKENIKENVFLEVLATLEALTYPLKIETDSNGNFKNFFEFDNWLQEWQKNSECIINEFEDSENVKNIRNQYYDIIKNEAAFTKSKLKEPYWNLFFFNPSIDDKNKPDIGTTLVWNIKSIGSQACIGRTKILNPASKEIIVSFESNQEIEKNILEKIRGKANKKGTEQEEVKIKLVTESYFDTIEKKIKKKKANFHLAMKNGFTYKEEITITLKQ
ncbi:hypothetical protein SY27_14440 [Flavobacterium sp. 316]|uniref:hypothetical protein n=1 Tax=Flavobacterium sp. 316 TaxID=1603293 RepID=UPI0005E04D2C|nr:hypothetical protein [Flavobacterium sp. 316]KIX20318.1 hypothetical protein SY27_14440 [Flavobacterium sp. 316]